MAHTFEELRKLKVDRLREIAAELGDARLEGNTQMNKDHLLPLLCQVLGIDMHVHHVVVGVDKKSIKARIRTLKQERDQALADKDSTRLKQVRRKIHKMKRNLHKATV
ncbi:MAG: hypothetical protein O2782_11915 [bacterium]|nr:hypothetical protein [bacterium]